MQNPGDGIEEMASPFLCLTTGKIFHILQEEFGGVIYPAKTFRNGIQSRSGIFSIRLKSNLLANAVVLQNHSILGPGLPGSRFKPGTGWARKRRFMWFINELKTNPQLMHTARHLYRYRRKPVSQASYSCVCGSRPKAFVGVTRKMATLCRVMCNLRKIFFLGRFDGNIMLPEFSGSVVDRFTV